MSCKQCATSCTLSMYDRPRSVREDTPSPPPPPEQTGNENGCQALMECKDKCQELANDLSLEAILENVLGFYNDCSQPMEEFEKLAIAEFIESKRKTKYLYDGANMVKLKPPRNSVIKAILGRAYYTRRLLKQRNGGGGGGGARAIKAAPSCGATTSSCGAKTQSCCVKTSSCGTRTNNCKMRAIMPPPSSNPDQLGNIADYVPCTGAKVPVLIQNISFEIEYRAKNGCVPGTYLLAGSACDVKDLMGKFLSTNIPCIAETEIHTLTGTLKAFLSGLQEPLIPPCFRDQFTDAGQIHCTKTKDVQVKALVNKMPEANKDTLAFLIPHLQRIANCPGADMCIKTMATEFAEVLMGPSTCDDDLRLLEDAVEAILKVSPGFWNKIIEASASS